MKPRRMLAAVAASLFLLALPPSRAAEPPPRAEAVPDAPLVSRGVMEAELLQHIRERLWLAPKTSTGARWLDSPTVDEPVLLALAGHERHEITGLGHRPSCRRAVNQVSPLAASVDELIRP